MSFEQAVFKAFLDAYKADTGAGGLFPLLNPGGMDRQDGSAEQDTTPRAEFNFINHQPITTLGKVAERGAVQITVICKRDNAFGLTDNPEAIGLIDQITNRIKFLYDGALLSSSTYHLSRIVRINQGRGEANPDVVRRYFVYRVKVVEV
jgi:hypothetical protein